MKFNQKGFTAIEIILAIAIGGIIAGGIATSTLQAINVESQSKEHMVAIQNVQQAGHWINLDAQKADTIVIGEGNGFPLIMQRTAYDGTFHETTYTISGTTLTRSHSINGGAATNTLISNCIDSTGTTCSYTEGVLLLTVTARSGEGTQEKSEYREYKIAPRPEK